MDWIAYLCTCLVDCKGKLSNNGSCICTNGRNGSRLCNGGKVLNILNRYSVPNILKYLGLSISSLKTNSSTYTCSTFFKIRLAC